MQVSEKEAIEKVCPVSLSGGDPTALSCLGSRCMAWVWIGVRNPKTRIEMKLEDLEEMGVPFNEVAQGKIVKPTTGAYVGNCVYIEDAWRDGQSGQRFVRLTITSPKGEKIGRCGMTGESDLNLDYK